jgi:hypothetical protein
MEMGLRGAHANVRPNHQQPPDDLVITAEALRLYKRMRALDRQCRCPPLGPDWVDNMCAACTQWWELNGELNAALGLGPIAWLPSYEAPDDECERDYKPRQSGRDRFHLLERAASKAKKEPKFRFKWEK